MKFIFSLLKFQIMHIESFVTAPGTKKNSQVITIKSIFIFHTHRIWTFTTNNQVTIYKEC